MGWFLVVDAPMLKSISYRSKQKKRKNYSFYINNALEGMGEEVEMGIGETVKMVSGRNGTLAW